MTIWSLDKGNGVVVGGKKGGGVGVGEGGIIRTYGSVVGYGNIVLLWMGCEGGKVLKIMMEYVMWFFTLL